MIKLVHYEVYVDKGNGWQLEERFSSEDRGGAFNLAKELELLKIKVKIIKEIYEPADNTYQEVVEYVSNLNANSKKKLKSSNRNLFEKDVPADSSTGLSISKKGVMLAVVKLLIIIALCLLLVNFLVFLMIPVVEVVFPDSSVKTVLFCIFFFLFLSIAIPLILKKVPWYVFTEKVVTVNKYNQHKFFKKADYIYKLYNINDKIEDGVTPSFPEATPEYKAYVVSFLSEIMTQAESKTAFKNSFSRLGLKLIIYGGCLELARYGGLKFSHANSLLLVAFEIVDGKKIDLVKFYEAKRAYSNNKIAVFLTGVGAYLMAQTIQSRPLDVKILKDTFEKWETLNPEYKPVQAIVKKDIHFNVIVNIKNKVSLYDDIVPNRDASINNVKEYIQNLRTNLVIKYSGASISNDEDESFVSFAKVNNALEFGVEYLHMISFFKDDIDDENLKLDNGLCICGGKLANFADVKDYSNDILTHTLNEEVVITEEINDKISELNYKTEFLGEKKLLKTEKEVALYKLVY